MVEKFEICNRKLQIEKFTIKCACVKCQRCRKNMADRYSTFEIACNLLELLELNMHDL